MIKVGDTVRVLPNKKVGKVTDISDGFVILDGNQTRPYMPQQLELVRELVQELKRYVLLENNKIYDTVLTRYVAVDNVLFTYYFGSHDVRVGVIKKTSDNILDLVEVGDLVEINEMSGIYYVDSIIIDEGLRVFTCDQKYGYWFDFNETEVKAIYKRQTNGDYKRYEVEA
jgi:hypothetical protein